MTRQEELVQAARKEYPEWEEAQCHFIDGAHYADSHPHWFSVEDCLPKEDGYVIVSCADGVGVWSYDKSYSSQDMKDYNHITHWMPLPQAPKGGEE